MPRALWIALLMTIPALAGCLAGDQADDDTADDASESPIMSRHATLHRGDAFTNGARAPAALANASAQWLSVAGMDAREPTVAVDSQGALYYAARDYSGGTTPPVSATQTPIMKSTDGGLSWRDVSPGLPTGDREPPRSGDPMVVADAWTDRIFQIELYDLVCNWLVYTDDGGESWTGNAKACSSLVVDHQTIGSGPSMTGVDLPVYPNMVYVCVNQIADSHCSRSLDGGLSFGTFHLVFPGVNEDGELCGGIHGHVLVAPDGTVYLPREYCGDAYVGVSRDDGLTWDLVDVDGGHGEYGNDPNMAFDAAGNVYYAFTGSDGVVYVTWTADAGATWSQPVRASPPGLTFANHPSITAGDDGRIGLVFLGTDSDGGAGPETWTWHSYMGVSLDATAESPTFATVRVNEADDPVYRGDCRSIRCGYVREFLDASVAPDGSFWGAFVDACLTEEEAKYEGPGDCNTEPGDYGQGNGHLGYVGHLTGVPLYVGEAKVSGGG